MCIYLCSSKVQVHLVVSCRDEFQVKVAHTVDLKLEGQGWLKMTVDLILHKLSQNIICHVYWDDSHCCL